MTSFLRGHGSDAHRVFAAFGAFGLLWGAWAAIVPLVEEATGASSAELGLALLGVGLGTIPSMILVGRRIDRLGARVLPYSLLALGLAAIPPGLATSVPVLFLALLAWGAAAGAVDVAINAVAADIEARTGDRIMQLAHGLFSLGVLTGAITAGVARELGAGRLPILAGASLVLLTTAFVNRGARSAPLPARTAGPTRGLRRLRGAVVALGVVCFTAFLVESGIENWSALFMERELGTGPLLGALGPGSYALAMVAGRFSGQIVSGRIADRRLLAYGSLVSTTGLLVTAAAPAPGVALAGFFLGGAGVSVAAPVAFGAAGRAVGGEERGSAIAAVTTMGYLGLLLGPALAGLVAEASGLRATFVVLAAFSAVIGLIAPRLALGPSPPPPSERATA